MQTPTHLVSRRLPNLGCAKRFLPAGVAAPALVLAGAEALRKSGVVRSVEVRRFSNDWTNHREAKNPFTFNFEPTPGSFTVAASTCRVRKRALRASLERNAPAC